MARGFSEREREYIRQRLLEKGREHFERLGVKRTNIADLAREAGIAKGSFYLFFQSKEDLFMSINEEYDRQLQQEVARTLEISQHPKETLRQTLLTILDMFNTDPMLRLAANKEEFESLSRKIPADQFRHHQESTTESLARLVEIWQAQGILRTYDPRIVVGVVKSLYYVVLHREFIGEDIFPQVVDLIINSLLDTIVIDKE